MAGNSRSKNIILTDEARVLKRLRAAKGLSLHQVATMVGKSYSTIAHIENGRMGIPHGQGLIVLLEVYGISLRSFQNYVGSYHGRKTPKEEINELIDKLSGEKVELILKVAKAIAEGRSTLLL